MAFSQNKSIMKSFKNGYSVSMLILLFIALQCTPVHHHSIISQPSNSTQDWYQTNEYKEIYINQFKLTYFRLLLQRGYNESNALHELLKSDNSGFTEPVLSISDYKLIDSLVEIDNLRLVQDSINSVGRVAEGAEGKHVLQFILDKLENRRLDSIANKRYYFAKSKNFNLE